jgi:phage terminase large subunit-like protein
LPSETEIAATPESIERYKRLREQLQAKRWEPFPWQIPPAGVPGIDWYIWLLFGGRGAGKTDGGAHYMNAHALGPPCIPGPIPHRMAIVAPTLGDASDACVNGPSGLKAHNGQVRELTKKGGSFVLWPNGSEAKLFGAYTKEEPERLRAGGNRCMVWMDELAAWRYLAESWKHIQLGLLRLGPHPHAVATTTPRNRPTVKAVLQRAKRDGSLTHGRTDQNEKLAPHIREALLAEYGGTRVGEQELEGKMIEDVVGALWNDELIEQCRIDPKDAPSDRQRLVIAVDPSWGTTNDEVGIVAGYRGPDGHAYILEDLSATLTPSAWGQVVSYAYDRLSADKVIAEGNFQGEQVRLAMKVAQTETDIRVNFDLVNASRGKALRAEPVVALYEQNRVHHIGRHAGLEYQMTHWVPPQNSDGSTGLDAGDPDVQVEPDATDVETSDEAVPSNYSPDRVDALVFLVTELLLGKGGPAQILVPKGRVAGVGRGTMRGRW